MKNYIRVIRDRGFYLYLLKRVKVNGFAENLVRKYAVKNMSESKLRVHIRFTGYVQGVGFRYRLSHLAQRYGVTGWVRNEYDGSVSAELQGLPEEIDQIIQQLQQDRYIEIQGMDRRKISMEETEYSFQVRY